MTATKIKTETNPYGLRAPASLMTKVKKRATKENVSISSLVHAIFVNYAVSPSLGVNLGSIDLGKTLPLPKSAAKSLLKMRDSIHDVERGEDRFNAYLAALNKGGWSMQAVAKVLGMTRQAVSLRVKKAEGLDFDDLPDVPARSPHTRARTNLGADEVHKFAARLDPALHEEVRTKAKREGAGITAILVEGLESYVAGTLTIPEKNDEA